MNGGLEALFLGYTTIWLILAVYIVFLGLRLRKLEEKIAGEEKESRPDSFRGDPEK